MGALNGMGAIAIGTIIGTITLKATNSLIFRLAKLLVEIYQNVLLCYKILALFGCAIVLDLTDE